MIKYKTPEQIEIMKKSGSMLATALWDTVKHVKPGVTELELDRLAEKRIAELGGESGFKRVEGYHHTICAATNEVVVHGIPTEYALKKGDVICIDCGVFYNGFHTDMAETVIVGGDEAGTPEVRKFLAVGKQALEAALEVAKPGNRIGNISQVIQEIVEGAGYSIVRNLVGHGVGRELHEEPEVPGYIVGALKKTPELKPGMTIAIEVIYNMGGPDVEYAGVDGWTIKTADGSLSAVFERSIAITKDGTIVLTK